MPAVVGSGAQQPILVIPLETEHSRFAFVTQRQYCGDAPARIVTAVDVVAQENHYIILRNLTVNLTEQILQCSQIAMDVTNRERGHASRIRSTLPSWLMNYLDPQEVTFVKTSAT
jgi:hypothetical protein